MFVNWQIGKEAVNLVNERSDWLAQIQLGTFLKTATLYIPSFYHCDPLLQKKFHFLHQNQHYSPGISGVIKCLCDVWAPLE